jgi:sec-independent protein translocase protein TatA
MGSFSIWHILILGAAALLLFGGRGKISDFMGDFGKGIKSFKKGLIEEDAEERASNTSSTNQQRPAQQPSVQTTLGASVPSHVIES